MKRVIVTGAGGQLGRSIQDLQEANSDFDFYFADRTQLDITDQAAVLKTFRKFKPNYCINCAAFTAVEQAEKTPEAAFKINADGVENIVRACKENQTVLLHISTDYVFDGKKTSAYSPSDTPNPINVYGASKLRGERIVARDMERYHIVRTSWLYSKKYSPNFLPLDSGKGARGPGNKCNRFTAWMSYPGR